jgi:multidrug efflux pump
VAKADADSEVILWANLTGTGYDTLALTDYADRYLVDRLSSIDGVAQVNLGGGQTYAMRVWPDPAALAARRLSVADVQAALRRENIELPGGSIESTDRDFTVRVERGFRTRRVRAAAAQRGDDGHVVRLGEVARVALESAERRSYFRGNGKDMLGLGIVKTSTANSLQVAQDVKDEIAKINPRCPRAWRWASPTTRPVHRRRRARGLQDPVRGDRAGAGGDLAVPGQPARGADPGGDRAGVRDRRLHGAVGLRLLDQPADLAGAGAVDRPGGRRCHRGAGERAAARRPGRAGAAAALRGTRQVGFAVMATTAVLIAVFVPMAFQEGNNGRLFRELAVALAGAVAISMFVALTLTR